ncbi:MAG: hypothetical protein CMJ35_01805 [Phycisphaerae bacterium]|nr:hypothetical protein [Phycisphaerae bacterium]MBM90333.1 hypothetical protein [Phycisphaerae bacterium]
MPMADPFAPTNLQHAHALVMGLGRFGGGLGVTRYLLRHGARVTLSDRGDREALREPLSQLGEHERLRVVLGEHDAALLDGVDLLVVNPAVPRPWDHAFIQAALARGIRVTTEIEIAYRLHDPDRVIAITGSAGKSTTSAMTHHALNACAGKCVLGGNIGGSLLDRLDEIGDETSVVLELSSAMIHWLWGEQQPDPPRAPRVACITSYAPNHMDWHGDESHYRACKQRLIEVMGDQGRVILPESLASWSAHTHAPVELVNDQAGVTGCVVPGTHNAMNASCAVACAFALHPEIDRNALVQGVRAFSGLPHRLNRALERDGVVYFDDSKSTTPQATMLAVSALRETWRSDQIHLIAGGYDKGSDLSPVAQLAPDLAGLYTIGATGSRLASDASSNAIMCETLDRAMGCIIQRVEQGDVVLLSPGCASWDQFANYEARGRRFIELAQRPQGATPC